MPVAAISDFNAWKPGDDIGSMRPCKNRKITKRYISEAVLWNKTIPSFM